MWVFLRMKTSGLFGDCLADGFLMHIIENFKEKAFGITKMISYSSESLKGHNVDIEFNSQYIFSFIFFLLRCVF